MLRERVESLISSLPFPVTETFPETVMSLLVTTVLSLITQSPVAGGSVWADMLVARRTMARIRRKAGNRTMVRCRLRGLEDTGAMGTQPD